MSKVTRSKLKFLIYILLQETNKINRKFFQILNDFFRIHSSASRAFVTRKRFSACWGSLHSVPVGAKPRSTGPRAPPIPIERCLRHRAAHPFRMLQRQFLPKKKARCSMSITPTLHRTFHHRLLCLFSSSCRTSCSCSCSFFYSSPFRISCTVSCAPGQSCISNLIFS